MRNNAIPSHITVTSLTTQPNLNLVTVNVPTTVTGDPADENVNIEKYGNQ